MPIELKFLNLKDRQSWKLKYRPSKKSTQHLNIIAQQILILGLKISGHLRPTETYYTSYESYRAFILTLFYHFQPQDQYLLSNDDEKLCCCFFLRSRIIRYPVTAPVEKLLEGWHYYKKWKKIQRNLSLYCFFFTIYQPSRVLQCFDLFFFQIMIKGLNENIEGSKIENQL